MLFNSLSRQLEPFNPIQPGEARIYTCGPTVYDYPHVGNMRAYVFADTLGRVLTHKGYSLKHVINITDVGHLTDDADSGEDKLEKSANKKSKSIYEIAQHYTDAFFSDVAALNIREPADWPRATEYVPMMIDFASKISERHCYLLDGGLYFDVSTVPTYGHIATSKARTEESGESRIKQVGGKRQSADFAIWRRTAPGESRQMEWDSPWGKGAPGWHLECSVMSAALLGLPFDIHTGGIDHREIHHPNEIAQNQAYCGCADCGARIWMHNNFLVERTGKMSKSSGQFLRLKLLRDRGYHPMAFRLMCLQSHYRNDLDFSWDNLRAALTRLKRMVLSAAKIAKVQEEVPVTHATLTVLLENFETAISDDLNTPLALTSLDELLALKSAPMEQRLNVLRRMDFVFGLGLTSLTRVDLRLRPTDASIDEASIEAALEKRQTARAAQDFSQADTIRRELLASGVEVMDGDPIRWDWGLSTDNP
ncbi:cysteine--tRNA ligase [Rhizobium rhizogenes]|uniref:cysteine--tRNA ligase n=1 Tax=Rhizobium rhizogenes TaxID=359 RepID=UPI001AEDF52E|nr:cysteine--tRNA ligase [Rhizobium rhizogenes]